MRAMLAAGFAESVGMGIAAGWQRASAVAATAAALCTGGCASLQGTVVAAPPQGGAVAVKTGAPLVVSLPVDPDTGYGWVLKAAGSSLAVTGGPDYMPSPKPAGATGEAGSTVYRFRAGSPGPTTLEFDWSAPAGTKAPAVRSIRYDVTILPREFFGIL
jgi:inhibitor of cysteine peptidase